MENIVKFEGVLGVKKREYIGDNEIFSLFSYKL